MGIKGGVTYTQLEAAKAAAIAAGLGEGQNWQDVTGSRIANTVYTNTTGKAILVVVSLRQLTTVSASSTFIVDGVTVAVSKQDSGAAAMTANTMSVIVGAGRTYLVSSFLSGLEKWAEYR